LQNDKWITVCKALVNYKLRPFGIGKRTIDSSEEFEKYAILQLLNTRLSCSTHQQI